MIKDYPSINVTDKSNEENMQVTKAYLISLVDQLNYEIAQLSERVSALEKGDSE